MFESVGPVAIGAVIGWMLYFFMRLYKIFSPRTLGATITALLGGEALSFIHQLSNGAAEGQNLADKYFLGVGIGFFSYAIYAGIISLLFAFGKIKGRPRFEIAVGCGAGISDQLDLIEKQIVFEDFTKKWYQGDLTDEDFKLFIGNHSLTQIEYVRAKCDGVFELTSEILNEFESKGFRSLLPSTNA